MYRAPAQDAAIVVACMYQKILGVDRRTGAHVWKYDAGGTIKRLAIAGERIYAGGSDRLVCLEYPSGKPIWQVASPVFVDTFFVDGEEIFVAGSGEMAAFAKSDGRLLWHDPLKGWGQFGIAFASPAGAAQIDDG